MWLKCEKCGRLYDDAEKWTICPHHLLGTNLRTGAGYCKRHDLYEPCPVCELEKDSGHTIGFAE